ncbi:MAG: MFS transporter, partial [Alphaproteobacteria bacterium]|nr:MFS transporter [Alphaproteobacteria bacterium]
TALGFAFSAFAYPYAIFQLIGGWFGDKFGPRATLGASGLIVCASTALTGAVGGLTTLVLVRLALGFGEGAAFPTATRAMSAWLPASRWGFAQGVTHSASRIGNALTPPLIAWLIAILSWRGSFVVLGAAALIWMIVWVWFFRDDPRTHPRITAAELEDVGPGRASASHPKVPWLSLARRVLPVTAVDFCYGWTLWLFLSWIPSFFFHNFHLDLAHSALFSSGVFLSGVVGDTLGGIVSDRILRRTGNLRRARCWVISGGLFGGFLFMIPVVLVHDLALVAMCLSAAFFCVELVVAPIWAVPMDIAPPYAGSASGIMNFGFGLAGIISPFVFGYVIDVTGSWSVPFIASLALLLIGAALALRLRPDQPFLEPAAGFSGAG